MINYSLDRLIRIAITLSAEKQIDALLDTILAEAMEITAADGGTIYIREGEQLSFHNVVTRSLGVHLIRRGREEILPPVPMDRLHVCACAALEHRLVNIPDVYEAEDYNFTGTRRYDAINHYRTRSMLVVPMEDEKGRCIGVLQLLNALNEKGEVVPFRQEDERIIAALGSLAAVSLYNRQLQKAVTDIMHSFVQVMVDAIDARTPFNASHTRSMVRYAGRFVRWLNRQQLDWRFEEDETEPFLMSVWLHDIGKIAIPTAIMDKRTRLGSLEEGLRARIDIALLQERIRALENPEAAAEAEKQICLLRQARDTIRQANPAGFLPEELGGIMQLNGQIERSEMDAIIYFYTPVASENNVSGEANHLFFETIRLCDEYCIPAATNLASAEILILGIQNGDLDWRL